MQAIEHGNMTAQAAQSMLPCPACGRRDGLVVLGARQDHTHPWLVWRTTRTYIYTCLHCEAIVAMEEQRAGRSRRSAQSHAAVSVVATALPHTNANAR